MKDFHLVKRGRGNYASTYRPCTMSEVVGQSHIKKAISKALDGDMMPTASLLVGPSGTGKTTTARIIGMGLNCEKGPRSEPCGECEPCKQVLHHSSLGFKENDAGCYTGIDFIRKERSGFASTAIGHRNSIFLFDECHKLSKDAQTGLLKPIEDAYPGSYFILCTTEPTGVIDTLRYRCMSFEFQLVADADIELLLVEVCEQEGVKLYPDVLNTIIKAAQGMPRNALTLLQREVLSGNIIKSAIPLSMALSLGSHGAKEVSVSCGDDGQAERNIRRS